MLPQYFKCVSRMFQNYSKGVFGMFCSCVWAILSVFERVERITATRADGGPRLVMNEEILTVSG